MAYRARWGKKWCVACQDKRGPAFTEVTDPEPYLVFYALLQRDIDFRARTLHAAIRESVAGFSPSLVWC